MARSGTLSVDRPVFNSNEVNSAWNVISAAYSLNSSVFPIRYQLHELLHSGRNRPLLTMYVLLCTRVHRAALADVVTLAHLSYEVERCTHFTSTRVYSQILYFYHAKAEFILIIPKPVYQNRIQCDLSVCECFMCKTHRPERFLFINPPTISPVQEQRNMREST